MANEVDEQEVKEMIDGLIERAKKASKEYLKLNQDQVNNIIKAMSMARFGTSHGTCKACCRRD